MKIKFGDALLALVVIAIIIIIIVPIPSGIIDVLLSINLSISLIILLNALYSKEALDMSLFPSLLLITTLYRLALNIASTKLIIGSGNAGEVIEAFGSFVGGNNIVVGAIIFIIITIIQLTVITKGSERVSEVAARFTLDAMPGKQMAIDADLNSGLINEEQAKTRRKKVQDEANFYGAMDGASKFVKGDAIAGILVAFVNIIGGSILGYQRFGNISETLTTYTILTIGDGLVSQIPSLLISTATGIMVTKAATDSNLSSTLTAQLFSSSRVLYITGGVIIGLGIFTQLPTVVFMVLGGLIAYAGYRIQQKNKEDLMEVDDKQEEIQVDQIRKPENVISLLQVDPIELEFGYGIIPLADVNQGGDLLDRVVMIRRQIALELGTIVPIIRLRDNIQLSPNQYIIKIKGVEVSRGELLFDHYLAMNPGFVEEEIDGMETVEPAFGLPALWISEVQREKAEMLGYTVVDPPSIIATHLTEVIKRHLHELLTRQDVQVLVDNIKETNNTLVDELIPKLLTIGEIQKVLGNLLKEGVSIRDLVTVLETLADYAAITRDPDMLTEYTRQALARGISKKFLGTGQYNVITLHPTLEQKIMDSVQQTERGTYLAIDPQTTQQILNQLNNEIKKLISSGQQPIVLTSPIVRLYFKRLTEQVIPNLIVLSYNEIDSTVEVQSIGMVSI